MREYKFNAVKAREECVQWIKEQAKNTGFTKAVIAVSGGKDSTIAAALLVRALGAENVHALLLPCGIQKDISDSYKVCKALKIEYDVINIKPIYDATMITYAMDVFGSTVSSQFENEDVAEGLAKHASDNLPEEARINVLPRIRMMVTRLWAQANHHRMCGTSNLSEITLGYCTKDGDTSNDFNPLGGLTSIEVVEVGKTMKELPKHLVVKTPADGLSGKTDEEKLGVTYLDTHKYIRNIDMDKDTWYKIHEKELKNMHKRVKCEFKPSNEILYINK